MNLFNRTRTICWTLFFLKYHEVIKYGRMRVMNFIIESFGLYWINRLIILKQWYLIFNRKVNVLFCNVGKQTQTLLVCVVSALDKNIMANATWYNYSLVLIENRCMKSKPPGDLAIAFYSMIGNSKMHLSVFLFVECALH